MTRIRFENSPSTNTPINASNLDKLNNVVISPTQPTTGEEVWIDDINKKIYTKNDNGGYEEFYNEDKQCKMFNLLDSSKENFTAGTSVTLVDDVSNYDYVEVICARGTDYGTSSCKFKTSSYRYPQVIISYLESSQIRNLVIKLKATNNVLECIASSCYNISSSGVAVSVNNHFTLVAVIGYKITD